MKRHRVINSTHQQCFPVYPKSRRTHLGLQWRRKTLSDTVKSDAFAPQPATSFLLLGNKAICSQLYGCLCHFLCLQRFKLLVRISMILSFWEQRGLPLTNVGQTSQKNNWPRKFFALFFRCFVGLVDQNTSAKVCSMSAKNDYIEIRQPTSAHCVSAKTFHDDCLVNHCFFSQAQLKLN